MSADSIRAAPKPASAATVAANQAVVLSFDDPGDHERATRGLVAQLDGGRVTIFDIVGVRFDPSRFRRGPLMMNVHFTDLGEDHVLGVGRSAIHHRAGAVDDGAVASIRINRATFSEALADAAALGAAAIVGDRDVVTELFASLTVFDTAALIEPRPVRLD